MDMEQAAAFVRQQLSLLGGYTHVVISGTNPFAPPHVVTVVAIDARDGLFSDDFEARCTIAVRERQGSVWHDVWEVFAGPERGAWDVVCVAADGTLADVPESASDTV